MSKPKLVMFHSSAPPEAGGVQSILEWLGNGLSDVFEVVVVARRSEAGPVTSEPYGKFTIVRAREMHTQWYRDSIRDRGSKATQQALVEFAAKHVAGADAVLVHNRNFFPEIYGALAEAGKAAGAKTAHMFHLHDGIGNEATPAYDLNIFVSPWLQKAHMDNGGTNPGIVLPMGIDFAKVDPLTVEPHEAMVPFAHDGVSYFVTGNLWEGKGDEDAVRGFALTQQRKVSRLEPQSGHLFLSASDPTYRRYLEDEVIRGIEARQPQISLLDRVHFLEMDHAGVLRALKSADVALAVSRVDEAGYPQAVLEAMRMKVPLIVTRGAGTEASVHMGLVDNHGRELAAGLIVERRRANQIANAMEQMEDPGVRAAFAERATERVTDNFDSTVSIRGMKGALSTLLGRSIEVPTPSRPNFLTRALSSRTGRAG